MQISCPQCAAQYNVDEARIPPQGVSIKCPRCQNSFVVPHPSLAGPGGGADIALPGARAAGAVPLPGAGAPGAVPLPGSGRGGAVPLPGQGAAAVPLPGMGAAAVPLPGMGSGVPLPGSRQPGAVPLPGQGGAVPLPGMGGSVPLPGMSGQGGGMPSMQDIFSQPPPAAAAPDPGSSSGPNSRALSMNDIFGDVSGSGGDSNRVQHPFHGTNSVMVNAQTGGTGGGSGADIFGFIDNAGKADAMPRQDSYSIRKRSGRVLGPYDAQQVLSMFHKGELLGSEEASSDGVTWRPLAQVPAFSATIQQAMASALSGLDDLPIPKGSGMEDLPVPADNLPVPKRKNEALAAAQEAFPELGTEALREAEKAKEGVERKRRAKAESTRGYRALAAAVGLALVVAVGMAVNFMTPYGYFGYKIVFPDKVVEAPKKPDPVVEAAPPPPTLPQVDQDYGDLLRADSYVTYRQGAEQAGRAVDAGKGMTPFPESAKKAAAQQVRFLAYLVIVEELPAFLAPLKGALPLAAGDDVAKALGDAAVAYSEKQWDKGLAALSPLKDPARGLEPFARSEVLVWTGIGSNGKGAEDAAVHDWDDALQATMKSPLALYLQALNLSQSGQPDAAIEYTDKVLALNENHPRAMILKGRLLSAKPETLDAGKALLVEMSEGKKGEAGSPQQRAQAYMGRADIAIAARQPAEALRYLQKAVEIVPQSRAIRIDVADTALRLHDFNVAREHGKKLLEADPDDVDGTIIVARAKMGTRDVLSAYTELQAVVKRVPDSPVANYWFGVAAREMSKPEEARALLEKAAKLDPKRADPIVDLMTDLIDQGKLADALKRGEEAEKTVSAGDRYKVRSAKAYALLRKRDFPAAEKELKAALEENPKDTDVRARYATLLILEKRLDVADKAVDEALQLDSKNPAVIVASGDVLMSRGDAKAALERYQEAMQIAPNDYKPYLHAALAAVNVKDIQRAKGFVETAGQLRAGVTDVVAVQGIVMQQTDPTQGERLLQQAIDQSPLEPGLHFQKGAVSSAMGKPLEALDALKQAVALDPGYVDAHYLLGKVSRDLGNNPNARASYEKCVEIDKLRVDCWIELADLLATANQDADALKAYESAIKADPKNPITTCALGGTLVARMGDDNKNLKRGIEVLERCVKLDPKNPEAFKHLGNAYKQTGKKAQALKAYRTHLVNNPNDDEALMIEAEVKDLGG